MTTQQVITTAAAGPQIFGPTASEAAYAQAQAATERTWADYGPAISAKCRAWDQVLETRAAVKAAQAHLEGLDSDDWHQVKEAQDALAARKAERLAATRKHRDACDAERDAGMSHGYANAKLAEAGRAMRAERKNRGVGI